MTTHVEHFHLQAVPDREKFYSPDILPLLQTILADLADIDFAHEKSLEAIKHSGSDEGLKSEMIASLQRRHRERRAPYIRELMTLRARIETAKNV